ARAEALDAGEVLVARGQIDGALTAELRFERDDGHAIRFLSAIAAALADLGVDEDALVGIGKLAALAAAPLLRIAGLIVDESRDAFRLGQRPLHGHQLAAMMRRNAIGQTVGALVLIRLVRDHLDAADALCQKLLRN